VIDSAAGKGLIHKNKAARHKSRLNAHIKALSWSERYWTSCGHPHL